MTIELYQNLSWFCAFSSTMKRRKLLISLGAVSTATVGGCSTQGEAESESIAPKVELISLISEYDTTEDIEDNAINSTTVGSEINIGYRYLYYHGDTGVLKSTEQVQLQDTEGNPLARKSDSSDILTDESGWVAWEYSIVFDSLDAGDYYATVQVRDDYNGKTSETASTAFRVER